MEPLTGCRALAAGSVLLLAVWATGCTKAGAVANSDPPATDGGTSPVDSTARADEGDEEVRFEVADGVWLEGTVTVPSVAGGPYPALVLVSELGPDDRDLSIQERPTFAALASQLAAEGLVVLRYDDRSVGGSGGTSPALPVPELADEVVSAVGVMRGRPDVDPDRVGLVAFGDGALVAATASTSAEPAFVVLLSPTLRPLADEWAAQIQRQADVLGYDVPASTEAMGEDLESLAKRAIEVQAGRPRLEGSARTFSDLGYSASMVETLTSPWVRTVFAVDPRPMLERVVCPMLALWGSVDLEVDVPLAHGGFERVFEDRRLPGDEARVLEGLNHRLQPAPDGLPRRYGSLPLVMAPGVGKAIAAWVLGLDGAGSGEPGRDGQGSAR